MKLACALWSKWCSHTTQFFFLCCPSLFLPCRPLLLWMCSFFLLSFVRFRKWFFCVLKSVKQKIKFSECLCCVCVCVCALNWTSFLSIPFIVIIEVSSGRFTCAGSYRRINTIRTSRTHTHTHRTSKAARKKLMKPARLGFIKVFSFCGWSPPARWTRASGPCLHSRLRFVERRTCSHSGVDEFFWLNHLVVGRTWPRFMCQLWLGTALPIVWEWMGTDLEADELDMEFKLIRLEPTSRCRQILAQCMQDNSKDLKPTKFHRS